MITGIYPFDFALAFVIGILPVLFLMLFFK